MKLIKLFISRWRENNKKNSEQALRGEFGITEHGDAIWLTHNGTPFKEIEPGTTASVIVKHLNSARTSAVEYYRL